MECVQNKICTVERSQCSIPLNVLSRIKCSGGCHSQGETDILSCIALPRHRNRRSNRDVLYKSFYRTPLSSSPFLSTWDGSISYLVEVSVSQHEHWADRNLISLNLHVRKSGHFIPHRFHSSSLMQSPVQQEK